MFHLPLKIKIGHFFVVVVAEGCGGGGARKG